jgi:murein DD-endopeptidase MepM/ murein hydrolase activator NlpD
MRRAARRACCVLGLVLAATVVADGVSAGGAASSQVAALQVALRAKGLYDGPVDGISGTQTERAVRALQRRAGLLTDGVVGPATRAALGRLGSPRLGARALGPGDVGWDVAELQFLLAGRGFPSGTFDGAFGGRTAAALRRFQRSAGITVDGRLGPATLSALSSPPVRSPLRLSWPLRGRLAEGFGPRGARFHAGIDIATPPKTPVRAAGPGTVTFAGRRAGGWGLLVVVAHGQGVRSLYAHLSAINVRVGDRVGARTTLGRVGATGHASGPHLHFEVRVRGAAVDALIVLR